MLESARGTEVCNQARAGFFSPALNRPLEDISDQACIPVPAAADLEIRKVDDPDPVRVGERITYTLTVTNNGPNTAEGVTVRDVLPNAVRFVSATPGPPVCTGPGPGLGGTVECDLGDLALNETRTITIVVEARRVVGERINTAEVESDTPDPDLDNNQDDEETTILRPTPPCADLTVKVKSPDRVKVGQRFPYTVTVRNPGPADVSDVVLTSRLPRSVQFVRAPTGCRYDRATRKVTCDLGDMPVGSEKQRRIVVKALEVGTVTLPGCAVRSGTPPCVPSNNTLDSAGARSAGGDEPRAPSAVGPETTVVVVAGPDGSSPQQGSSREEE